jgi:hypothetical protein
MKKHVAAVRLVDRDEVTEAVELPEELRLPLGAIAGVAREGLLAMCATVGLAVMGELMTAEMTAEVGGRSTPSSRSGRETGMGARPGRSCWAADACRSSGHGAAPLQRERWRDGKMIKRWCAAGMLNAERSFRRLRG